jgi:hypothetical protein
VLGLSATNETKREGTLWHYKVVVQSLPLQHQSALSAASSGEVSTLWSSAGSSMVLALP